MADRAETDPDALPPKQRAARGRNERGIAAALTAAPDPRRARSARIMTALDNLAAAQRELTLAIIDGLRS